MNCLATPPRQIELASADGLRRWRVLRPGRFKSLSGTHEFTAQQLAALAADYDPKVDRAPLNVDHVRRGPAYGWIQELSVDPEGHLVAVPELNELGTAAVSAGQYGRVSIEVNPRHEATGRPYVTGLALLGAMRPAVLGLDPIQAGAEDDLVQLTEEPDMPQTPTPPANTPAPTPPANTPSALTVELTADLTTARAQVAEMAELHRTAALSSAQLAVERLFGAGGRLNAHCTPAAEKLARPLLVELAASKTTIELAAGDGKAAAPVSLYDSLVALLAAQPSLSTLGVNGQRLASGEGLTVELAATDPAVQAMYNRHGVTQDHIKAASRRPN